mmetsp:Transcript_23221/g.72510  ORF Transcript_23221/g.72510 Transcript_23221/m.72510 type:complete len:376 (-) Transcript_23221:3558-4685(-)
MVHVCQKGAFDPKPRADRERRRGLRFLSPVADPGSHDATLLSALALLLRRVPPTRRKLKFVARLEVFSFSGLPMLESSESLSLLFPPRPSMMLMPDRSRPWCGAGDSSSLPAVAAALGLGLGKGRNVMRSQKLGERVWRCARGSRGELWAVPPGPPAPVTPRLRRTRARRATSRRSLSDSEGRSPCPPPPLPSLTGVLVADVEVRVRVCSTRGVRRAGVSPSPEVSLGDPSSSSSSSMTTASSTTSTMTSSSSCGSCDVSEFTSGEQPPEAKDPSRTCACDPCESTASVDAVSAEAGTPLDPAAASFGLAAPGLLPAISGTKGWMLAPMRCSFAPGSGLSAFSLPTFSLSVFTGESLASRSLPRFQKLCCGALRS